jgi:hypothetical protein
LATISLITMSASSMTLDEARCTVRKPASLVRAMLGVDGSNGRRTVADGRVVAAALPSTCSPPGCI